jgi:hypothetical protein
VERLPISHFFSYRSILIAVLVVVRPGKAGAPLQERGLLDNWPWNALPASNQSVSFRPGEAGRATPYDRRDRRASGRTAPGAKAVSKARPA